jgi:hypothetical protein
MSNTPTQEQAPDGAERPAIYVDNLCRLIIGALHSSPHMYPKAAEQYLEKIRGTRLTANARKGKGNQWFATLETSEGEILVLSNNFGDRKLAQEAASEALTLLGK